MDCSKAGLTGIPPDLPPTTVSLDLSANKLSSIPSKAFASIPKLRFLNLNGNRVSAFATDAFDGLPDLENLTIATNALKDNFDISSISASKSLLNLNLANNQLTKIPPLQTSSLKRLTLSSNFIRTAVFPQSFSNCFDLESVVLTGNQIADVAATDFDILSKLKLVSLNLNSNRITSFHPKAFEAVGLTLNNLDLNHNRLTSETLSEALKGYSTVGNIALVSLSVSYNAITSFDAAVLAPLAYTMFNSLQLDGHRLLRLDPKAFQSVGKSLLVSQQP